MSSRHCTALVQKIFHLRDELKKTEERFTVMACVQPHVAVASPTALLSAESPAVNLTGDSPTPFLGAGSRRHIGFATSSPKKKAKHAEDTSLKVRMHFSCMCIVSCIYIYIKIIISPIVIWKTVTIM